MKIKLLLCVILAGCTFGFAKEKADVRDITGCLSKGDSANEFVLTGTDGSTWEARSRKVALAEHVGHTVTATGVVSNATAHNMKEDAKDAAKDSQVYYCQYKACALRSADAIITENPPPLLGLILHRLGECENVPLTVSWFINDCAQRAILSRKYTLSTHHFDKDK